MAKKKYVKKSPIQNMEDRTAKASQLIDDIYNTEETRWANDDIVDDEEQLPDEAPLKETKRPQFKVSTMEHRLVGNTEMINNHNLCEVTKQLLLNANICKESDFM